MKNAIAALSSLLLLLSGCGGLSSPASSAREPRSPPGVTMRMPPDANGTEVTVYAPVSAKARDVANAPERVPADRVFDGERRPAELLTFLDLRPGMRVAVLVAGSGYTTELLARAVAPGGVVYAENPRLVLVAAERAWAARLATPAMRDVVRVDRELDDPLPPEVAELDLVIINLAYHDTVWLGVDRDRMNRAAYRALKHGGRYVVIDHSAQPGRGVEHVRSLHRIDEAVVVREVQRAGFGLYKEGEFLRNPSDPRDWNDSAEEVREGVDTSDRFAVMLVKP